MSMYTNPTLPSRILLDNNGRLTNTRVLSTESRFPGIRVTHSEGNITHSLAVVRFTELEKRSTIFAHDPSSHALTAPATGAAPRRSEMLESLRALIGNDAMMPDVSTHDVVIHHKVTVVAIPKAAPLNLFDQAIDRSTFEAEVSRLFPELSNRRVEKAWQQREIVMQRLQEHFARVDSSLLATADDEERKNQAKQRVRSKCHESLLNCLGLWSHARQVSPATMALVESIPDETVDILCQWCRRHRSHPYPTRAQRDELQKTTGLPETTLRAWFATLHARMHKKRIELQQQRQFPQQLQPPQQ